MPTRGCFRRAVKAGAPGKHAEVARLRKLLSQALAEPPVAASKAREQRIGALEHENRQLHKAVQTVEGHKETIRWQNREIVRLNAELRRLRDQKDKIRLLSEEAYRVRVALEVSEHAKEKLTARLAKLRALGRRCRDCRSTRPLTCAMCFGGRGARRLRSCGCARRMPGCISP